MPCALLPIATVPGAVWVLEMSLPTRLVVDELPIIPRAVCANADAVAVPKHADPGARILRAIVKYVGRHCLEIGVLAATFAATASDPAHSTRLWPWPGKGRIR